MEKGVKGLKFLNVINGTIQTKTYSFGIFTFVVVACLIVLAIRPTVGKALVTNSEIKENRNVTMQLDNKLNALALLTTEYTNDSSNYDNLSLVFPDNGVMSLFMSNIEEIAKNNGFTLTSINFGNAEKSTLNLGVLIPWSAKISVNGYRGGLNNFLQDIEAMPMYPVINKVSFTNDLTSSGQTPYSIEIVIYKINNSSFFD